MGREYHYSYNIAPNFDLKVFNDTKKILDSVLDPSMPRRLVEDYDFDGSMLQVYGRPECEVRLCCDWDIGAVFIDSDINLDSYFGDRRLRV